MKRNSATVTVLLALVASIAQGWLRSYEVPPARAAWSGWTRKAEPNNWVGNTFVANFDSICAVWAFIGFVGDTSEYYSVDVYEYETGTPMAHTVGTLKKGEDHHWVEFPMVTVSGRKFIRGDKYIVKITRPGDSIHYGASRDTSHIS
jgi:hypothetical protein